MPRVLLLLPTRSYRTGDFLRAAGRLGVAVTVASEEPSTLAAANPEGLLTLDFRNLAACADAAEAFAAKYPVDAAVGVDEDTAVAAAAVAERLGLPHNPLRAVETARDKAAMRVALARGGVAAPGHRVFRIDGDPPDDRRVTFPCVLKPTFLAASRGVIRADDPDGFAAAWRRIAAILAEPEVAARGGDRAREILVEDFVPGAEVALEALLRGGALQTLALFDKPDPLDGPFFEETIYVTPSRLSAKVQDEIVRTAAAGAAALGLVDGPLHAELRVHGSRAVVIEIAARSIGGLCARTLRFGAGTSLEEVILSHALRLEAKPPEREPQAAGVMMIPIPRAGRLEEVRGAARARGIPGIEAITISAHPGAALVLLPEGSRYLGFIFARGGGPADVEAALRAAHAELEFVISSGKKVRDPSPRSG